MPCEIGQNIYKLRKENRQLLDLLESNSVLLENKIKMLRHATRSPHKLGDLKNDMPSSPLKRRYEPSNRGECSSNDTSALTKSHALESQFGPEAALSDNENVSEKTSVHDIKKVAAKRVKHTYVVSSKTEVKKPFKRQTKSRMNIGDKTTPTSSCHCYCTPMCKKHVCQHNKFKEGVKEYSESKTEHVRNTKHLKAVNSHHCNDKEKLPETSVNQEELEMSSVCSKCMDEARRLLNYSPESVFLRRMKERLQNTKPLSKDHSKINQICNCENIKTCTSDSESDSSYPITADPNIIGAVNIKKTFNNNIQDQHSNIHSRRSDTEIGVQCCCSRHKIGNKDVQLQTSKHLINTSCQVPEESAPPKKKSSNVQSQSSTKAEASKSQKNILKKAVSGKSTSSATQSKRCLCKKQIGGLCCCEVARSSTRKVCCASRKVNPAFSAPLKSSVSAPVVPVLKTSDPTTSKQVSSVICDSESEQQKSKLLSDVHSRGYDVIASLLENDRRHYIHDPCTYQLEELSNFRQKHWFDCHAHPHGPATSELHSDSKECQNRISSFDDDLMQPTLDPCVRAYRLNQRLFPEAVGESHSAACCVARQGCCISPRLLPTQRRLITLPTVSHPYMKNVGETMKASPGVHTFPESNILICDPLQHASSTHNSTRTTSGSPRRLRRPVPSSSLALRFQKGVA